MNVKIEERQEASQDKTRFHDSAKLAVAASVTWLVSGLSIAVGLMLTTPIAVETGNWGHIASLALTAWWTFRVYKNMEALGNDSPKHSAAWMAGCYFLPIVTFFAPLMGLIEVQRHLKKPIVLMVIWWISLALTTLTGLMAREFDSMPAVRDGLRGGGILLVALLFFPVANQVVRLQRQLSETRAV